MPPRGARLDGRSEPFFVYDLGFIPLAGGGIVAMDIQDWKTFRRISWQRSKKGYAVRKGRYPLHRDILGLTVGDGKKGDHINGDRLDCRRSNLRVATHLENCRNTRSTSTTFKGVSRSHSRFKARIQIVRGNELHLGTFATPEEAARAYDRAATEHFGAFARLNFPAS